MTGSLEQIARRGLNLARKIAAKGPRWTMRKIWHQIRTSGAVPLPRIASGFAAALGRFGRTTEKGSALLGFYDLNANSPSYNFTQFLLCLENHAAQKGYLGYSVVIVPKELPEELEWKALTESYGSSAIDYRTVHLIAQLAMLGPRCRGVFALPSRTLINSVIGIGRSYPENYGFYLGGAFDSELQENLATRGVQVELEPAPHARKLVSDWASHQEANLGLVTITLRNSPFDRVRNSDTGEWLKFAGYLRQKGYRPVVIPDTDSAFIEPLTIADEPAIGTAAAFNPSVRLALYQRSFINFFVPNGPLCLAMYSKTVRYVCMKHWLSGSVVAPDAPEKFGCIDVARGAYVWASPGQWVNGEPDKFENLVNIFERFSGEFGEGASRVT